MIQEFGALRKTQANVDVEKIMSVSTSSFLSWDGILNESFDYAGNEILSLNKKNIWAAILKDSRKNVEVWKCCHVTAAVCTYEVVSMVEPFSRIPEMKYLWLHL